MQSVNLGEGFLKSLLTSFHERGKPSFMYMFMISPKAKTENFLEQIIRTGVSEKLDTSVVPAAAGTFIALANLHSFVHSTVRGCSCRD